MKQLIAFLLFFTLMCGAGYAQSACVTPATTSSSDVDTAISNATSSIPPKCVYLPAGIYNYSGTGPNWHSASRIVLLGDGANLTKLNILTNIWFVDISNALSGLTIRGIDFEGGNGAFRNRLTGSDDASAAVYRVVEDNLFNNFTQAAIVTNAADGPGWYIHRNTFKAASDYHTIAVALSGAGGGGGAGGGSGGGGLQGEVSQNNFEGGQVLFKCNNSCSGLRFLNNNIAHSNPWDGVNPRFNIWIVPSFSTIQSSTGDAFVISNEREGSENFAPMDYNIVVADGNFPTVTNENDFVPLFQASIGKLAYLHIYSPYFARVGNQTISYIESWTPNVSNLVVRDIEMRGAQAPFVVHFNAGCPQPSVTAPAGTSAAAFAQNVVGPMMPLTTTQTPSGTRASNCPVIQVDDPFGYDVANTGWNVPWATTAHSNETNWALPTTLDASGFDVLNPTCTTVTGVASPEQLGDSGSAKVTFGTCSGAIRYSSTATLTPGEPLYLEWDERVDGTALPSFQLSIYDQNGDPAHPANWADVSDTIYDIPDVLDASRLTQVPVPKLWRHVRQKYVPTTLGPFSVRIGNLAVSLRGTAPSLWRANTPYSVNQLVQSAGAVYQVTTAGTSGSTTNYAPNGPPGTSIPDTSSGSTLVWRYDQSSYMWGTTPSQWQTNTSYSINQLVQSAGLFYQVTTAGTSGSMTSYAPSGTGTSIPDTSPGSTLVWKYDQSRYMYGTNPVQWTPAHPYSTGDVVANGPYLYKATLPGTSASSGGPAGMGSSISDGAGLVWQYYMPIPSPPLWAASTPYSVGSYVANGPSVYQAVAAGTSGSTGPTGTSDALISDGSLSWRYFEPVSQLNIVPPAWVTGTGYDKGQYIRANGNIYVNTTAGTSASSGTGPSGTASAISDNAAVWAYFSPNFTPGSFDIGKFRIYQAADPLPGNVEAGVNLHSEIGTASVPLTAPGSGCAEYYSGGKHWEYCVGASNSFQVSQSYDLNLTAAGSSQGTATPLAATISVISTVSSGTGVILLGKPGVRQELFNKGANPLKVYPAMSGSIDSSGMNNPITIATNGHASFVCVTASACYQTP